MKNKRITILLIIVNIILIGIICSLISKNGNIIKEKQIIKEMNESTQVTELNNQINALNTEHTEYMNYIQTCKTKIATALENEGVTTSNDATLETMAGNISKVLKERTKDATATADNITEGMTAYVNGELITGNGNDSEKYYEQGRNSVISTIYGKTSTQYTTGWDSSSTLSASITSPTGYGSTTASKSGRSKNIYLAKTPNGETGYITSLKFDFTSACYGGGNAGSTKYTFYIYDSNNNLITKWDYSNQQGKITIAKALMDYCITGDYIYIKYDAYLQANGFTDSVMAWASRTEFSISNTITLSYII